jgi:hypothetical protein
LDENTAAVLLAGIGVLGIGAKIVLDEVRRKRSSNGHGPNPNAKTLDAKLDRMRDQLHGLYHKLDLQHEQSSAFRQRCLEVLKEIRDSRRQPPPAA